MAAPQPDSLCKEAEPYYYDFLFCESRTSIPELTINHIKKCEHCQNQVSQLKKALSQSESSAESRRVQTLSALTAMLELHFAYVDKPVACKTVRPFLPAMLDPAVEIRIPTPITAHLDNCRQCCEDLRTIQKMNLSAKQLCRLSQIFAEKPQEDNVDCSRARTAIFAVVSMFLQETTGDVLRHLCACRNCRKLLNEFRSTLRREYQQAARDIILQKPFPCEKVSTTDIFDYVVPYGLSPTEDQYAKLRESLTSHVRACPTCLGKMQQLHETVYGIVERAESGIVTIYNTTVESAKVEAASESDDLYKDFPISVQVINRQNPVRSEQSAPTVDFMTALRQKISAVNLQPLVKAAVAAAAVILVTIGLLFTFKAAPAKAITIAQVYEALENIKNVHILKFVPDKKEPIEEQWVSRASNLYATKSAKQIVLWDLVNKLRRTKQLGTNIVETAVLSDDLIAGVRKTMASSLGLMPFYDISEIPKDAKWSHVTDDSVEGITENTTVYALTWIEKTYGGATIFKKWRGFVHTKTNFPERVERYQRLATDAEYTLMSTVVVEYLSDNEIQAVIKDISF